MILRNACVLAALAATMALPAMAEKTSSSFAVTVRIANVCRLGHGPKPLDKELRMSVSCDSPTGYRVMPDKAGEPGASGELAMAARDSNNETREGLRTITVVF